MRNLLICLLSAALLVCGQLLLKMGAQGREISSVLELLKLALNPTMMAAIAVYAGAALLWVYIMTIIPLSYAYPIQALAFPIVVALSYFLLKETVPANRWVGAGIIVIGAFVASR